MVQPTAREWWDAASIWREHRESYPNWLVPHVEAISSLWKNTQQWADNAASESSSLFSLNPPTCVFVNYELLWRLRRALFPAYDYLAEVAWDETIARYSDWRTEQQSEKKVKVGVDDVSCEIGIRELDDAIVEVRLEQLRHARETGEFDRFERIRSEITESISCESGREPREHVRHFVTHQSILASLATWDDDAVSQMLSEWDTSSIPTWALRKGGLLIETGQRRQAEQLLNKTLEELRSATDEGTPESWSIESWVTHLLTVLDDSETLNAELVYVQDPGFSDERQERTTQDPAAAITQKAPTRRGEPQHDTQPRGLVNSNEEKSQRLKGALNWLRMRSCDPEELIQWVENNCSRGFDRTSVSETHGFDSRGWRITSELGGHVDPRLVPAYRALRLTEEAGLPLRSTGRYVLRSPVLNVFKKACRIAAENEVREAAGAILRLRNTDELEKWFSRRRVAIIPAEEIHRLFSIANISFRRLCENLDGLQSGTTELHAFVSASELLSRVAVRGAESELKQLLQFAISLPGRLIDSGRWPLVKHVAKIVRRTCDGLSTAALTELLPFLLKSPVPGSAGFGTLPHHIDWPDAVELWGERKDIDASAVTAACRNEIDELVQRLANIDAEEANKEERRCLVLRLVTLINRRVLDDKQEAAFAQALYAWTDSETELPSETGCYDSLVLLIQPEDARRERERFRMKYIKSDWPRDLSELRFLLESLSRTGPTVQASDPRRRSIRWSNRDLKVIADRCFAETERWCEGVTPESIQRDRFDILPGLVETPESKAREILQSLSQVIDQLLLARDEVESEQWEVVMACVARAEKAGLPMVRAYPKIATFEPGYEETLTREIVSLLSAVDEDRNSVGFFAFNHWTNQISDSRIPPIHQDAVSAIVAKLEGDYSASLLNALDAIRNLLDQLPGKEDAIKLLGQCDPSLKKWTGRLKYEELRFHRGAPPRMRDELPDLRASMTRLCVVVQQRDIVSQTTRDWLGGISIDSMPEIRRALES